MLNKLKEIWQGEYPSIYRLIYRFVILELLILAFSFFASVLYTKYSLPIWDNEKHIFYGRSIITYSLPIQIYMIVALYRTGTKASKEKEGSLFFRIIPSTASIVGIIFIIKFYLSNSLYGGYIVK